MASSLILAGAFLLQIKMIQGFKLFGFTPLETRSAEPLDIFLSKGETDKKIY